MKVRTRFAPSPTGYLHLGSLRTALFNWLWARKMKGEFILRLEDTDQSRLVPQAAEELMSDLLALGLDWDFGPDKDNLKFGSCIQSDRLKLYQEVAQQLLDQGVAYYDYTTSAQLDVLRKKAQDKKQAFIFRREMAQLKPDSQNTVKPVIRISIPSELSLTWNDVVKGEQAWQTKNIGDFIALKSDGWPTYHLANVVDDHLMEISHVIRADEWLSSTPKHLYLFDCLNWSRPEYVHVPPVLMSHGGQKLSKRDEAGRVTKLLKAGYLKEAVLNYLSLLGWNPKTTQEVFSIDELIQAFEIKNIQVSGARFDPIRLDWVNGQHLRKLPSSELQAQAQAWWPKEAEEFSDGYKNRILELVYQRIKKWADLDQMSKFFFKRPSSPNLDTLALESKLSTAEIESLIKLTLETLEKIEFNAGNLELELYQLAQEQKISPSKYFTLLRLKLTGQKIAPGLFQTMDVLGLKECQKRLSTSS